MNITARILPAKPGKGIWLFVDREGEIKNHPDDLEEAMKHD